MASRAVAKRISSLQPPEGKKDAFPPLETPEKEFCKVIEAYSAKGLGFREIFSTIFGEGNGWAAEKAAKCVDSFSEPRLKSSMAISIITVYEYTKSAEYVSRLVDFCLQTGEAGRFDSQAACTGSHIARIAASIGTTHSHNPSDTLDLIFSFSGSDYLRYEIVRALMCLSRISSGTFEQKTFNNVLGATKMLADVSPTSVRVFLTSLVRLSDMGEEGAVRDASGSMLTIWTFRRGCVAYMSELMDALANRDAKEIARIADDLRAIFCKLEPAQ